MKHTRHIFITALLLLMAIFASGQQIPSLSQYVFNDYAYNPAIGGIYDYYQVKTNYRQQWLGFNDAPRTYLLSAYGPHKSLPMGYGGYIINDVVGPTSKTGIYGSYAYNIRLTKDIRLSMGAFLGLIQYKIDMKLPGDDPAIINNGNGNTMTMYMPDATLGTYMYSSQYYAGISVMQLLGNKIQTTQDSVEYSKALARLNSHLVVMGGYKYNINRDFDIEAGSMIKYVRGAAIQVDLTVRSIYQKMVWLGVNYRSQDAIAIMSGYNYQDMLYVGLSYDLTTSEIRNYSSGSVEVMIGVKFNKIKQSSTRRKIR